MVPGGRQGAHFLYFAALRVPTIFWRPNDETLRMRARRDAAIRLFKVMLVVSLAVPVAMFSYAAWLTHRNAFAHADEQLSSSMDIISEQANKVFQSVDLTFTSVAAIVGDMADAEIKAQEAALHDKLAQLEKALNAVDAVIITDKAG